eukprot:9181165-Ditylum_brightwellii.AAC.1
MSKTNKSPSYDGQKMCVTNPYPRPNVINPDPKNNPYSNNDHYTMTPQEGLVSGRGWSWC